MTSRLFPILYDLKMAPVEALTLRARRRGLLRDVRGRVLEIGAGTGANVGLYPPSIELVLCEPDRWMRARLLRRLGGRASTHDLIPPARVGTSPSVSSCPAESLAFPDASIDHVVSTLVLCSVADLEATLREVHRVLKPGGTLRFLEHVRFETGLRGRVQDLVTPTWSRFACNCHMNRRTVAAMTRAGFDVHLRRRDVVAGLLPVVEGVARK